MELDVSASRGQYTGSAHAMPPTGGQSDELGRYLEDNYREGLDFAAALTLGSGPSRSPGTRP
jgi:hypothetical protein